VRRIASNDRLGNRPPGMSSSPVEHVRSLDRRGHFGSTSDDGLIA
jgi:hypothetical protein